MTTKRRVSGRRDVNPFIDVSPLELAAAFASHSPSLRDSPIANSILELFSSGSFAEGFSVLGGLPPEFWGGDISSFRDAHQFTALFKKAPLRDPRELHASSIEKWLEAEARCARSNRRFSYLQQSSASLRRQKPLIYDALHLAREIVHLEIGRLTPSVYKSIMTLARPGGGVAIGTRNRTKVAPVFKYTETDWTCYPDSLPVVLDFLRSNPGILFQVPNEFVKGPAGWVFRPSLPLTETNRTTFVPKDGKSLRVISVEPNLPLMIQLGVHEHLAKRLGRRGFAHLDDQRPNQLYAKLGSRSSSFASTLCTFDLSSASDTISREFVRWMIPEDWYSFLDAIRAKSTTIAGKVYHLEKFSSMGNGFTFALETLLFRALAEAARLVCGGGGITAAYGDDLVIPSHASGLFAELLEYCGFSLNRDKSYALGPFRESCGHDWYDGERVTPVYVRTKRLRMTDCHRIYNSINPEGPGNMVRQLLLAKLSRFGLLWGLENEDPSSCLFTTFAYAKGAKRLRYLDSIQNYVFRGITLRGATYRPRSAEESYRSALYSGMRGELPIKGRVNASMRWLTAGVYRPYGW